MSLKYNLQFEEYIVSTSDYFSNNQPRNYILKLIKTKGVTK